MAEHQESAEDAEAIRAALLNWKASGNPNPMIPMEVDVDGDGIVDSFALDENDNLIVVTGAKLADTVYVSDGDDALFQGE